MVRVWECIERHWLLFFLISLCIIIDVSTTVYGLDNNIFAEGNQVSAYLMSTIGLLGWATIRIISLLIPLAIAYLLQFIWEVSSCNRLYMFGLEVVALVALLIPNAICAVNNLIILF